MSDHYKIAIIGSGPGGMSAAAHAAELDISHILLEATDKHSNTIQKYQKGKHVMAEPGVLPLRSPLEFDAGTRENILQAWLDGLTNTKTNIAYQQGVTEISGSEGNFTINTKTGRKITADYVILGIGVQGNPRKLGVPGEDELGVVQYQLDDPDEYKDETIVVVGAGDAAIENAIALAKNNKVFIVNRRDEFARAKEGNLNLITAAIESDDIECFYESNAARIEPGEDIPCVFTLSTADGEAAVPCHRIIARLGAIPQRKLVESFGIEFPSADPNAIPELSDQYESNVKGLYIIGALGGYPLIKQAMNQGYEVVEYILGNDIEPADNPLLEEKFQPLPYNLDVSNTLSFMQQRIPLFSTLNSLLFRELMLDSHVLTPDNGEVIFNQNDYTNTFFTVLDGSVEVTVTGEKTFQVTIETGQFFGEMSLISGRRRSATVTAGPNCVLIETPRRTMNKLINSVDSVKRVLDEVFILRALQTRFAQDTPLNELATIASAAKLNQFKAKQTLFAEGDEADDFHLIRSGSVVVAKQLADREVVISYVPANNYVGEMGLLSNTPRNATIRANVATETVSLNRDAFTQLLNSSPGLREQIQATVRDRHAQNIDMETRPEKGDILSFLMEQGLGEATDVLLIDDNLCVGCDNCEKACAETHGGTSRLNREAGPTFASVHVPTSCRHCEHPHCMKDCPPDAIKRAANGEVYINESCIGCGNCERNCPYDVIHMAAPPPQKPSLWQWLLLGRGPGPGEDITAKAPKGAIKKAVKCDMCKDQAGGAACVRACPTGAALRLNPEDFLALAEQQTAS